MASGIPYGQGLVKNRYIGRTFMARASSGPMARASSGPMPRASSGPNAARPSAAPGASRPGPAAQPALAGSRGASAGRHQAQPEWADRTERIDRVGPNGYPDPRVTGRVQVPGTGPFPSLSAPTPAPARGRDVPDRRIPDTREPSRGGGTRSGGGWDSAADDDPLTSKAFSRAALTDTDGRSYRAARRPQVPPDRREAALTEQTRTVT